MHTVHVYNQWGGLHSISRYASLSKAMQRVDLVNSRLQFFTASLKGA